MKNVLLITLLLFFSAFANFYSQHTCNHKHHNITYTEKATMERSDTIDVINYDVFLDITDYSGQTIKGHCEVTFKSLQPNVSSIMLDLLSMTIDSIKQNNLNLTYSYNDTLLNINLSTILNQNETDSLTVYYHGAPQQDASGWGGWYWQGNYSYNLGVGFDADPHNYGRVWHPCFDNFVERATYDISILTNNGKSAYANGEIESENSIGIDSTIRKWHMPNEIPTYLACVAVADYVHVNQSYISPVTGDTTPIYLIAEPTDTTNLKNSFVNLTNAISTYESNYGPYMWNKVGYHLVPFNSGAMEHATSIAYPLATANGSTQYETLMAHELSHHWWGNLVTCRTSGDMWINEGMASYSEKLFLESVYGNEAYLNEVKSNHLRVLQFAHIDDGGYYALHGIPHNITYGTTTYDKGADVVHTMRSYFGDSLFFFGLKTFLSNNLYEDVDADDFLNHLNSISGINATDFFNDWIFNPGFPGFEIDTMQTTQNGSNYDVYVSIEQKLLAAPAFYQNVPMNITFVFDDWHEETFNLIANGQRTSFETNLPDEPVYCYLNKGDKISTAVTGSDFIIKNPGIIDDNYSMFKITTNSITDSVKLRVEHHWIAPDQMKDGDNFFLYYLSPERYWRISGVNMNNINATGRIFIDGRSNSSTRKDVGLVAYPGFHEDSLKVFHRVDATDDWQLVSTFSINPLGSSLDGYCFIDIENIVAGEYTVGWKHSNVNIEETSKGKRFLLYPNPTNHSITIDIPNEMGMKKIAIYDLNGKLVYQKQSNQTKVSINTSNFEKGSYLLSITEGGKFIGSQQFIKQ